MCSRHSDSCSRHSCSRHSDSCSRHSCSRHQCSRHSCSRHSCSRHSCSRHSCSRHMGSRLCSRHSCNRHSCSRHSCSRHSGNRHLDLGNRRLCSHLDLGNCHLGSRHFHLGSRHLGSHHLGNLHTGSNNQCSVKLDRLLRDQIQQRGIRGIQLQAEVLVYGKSQGKSRSFMSARRTQKQSWTSGSLHCWRKLVRWRATGLQKLKRVGNVIFAHKVFHFSLCKMRCRATRAWEI